MKRNRVVTVYVVAMLAVCGGLGVGCATWLQGGSGPEVAAAVSSAKSLVTEYARNRMELAGADLSPERRATVELALGVAGIGFDYWIGWLQNAGAYQEASALKLEMAALRDDAPGAASLSGARAFNTNAALWRAALAQYFKVYGIPSWAWHQAAVPEPTITISGLPEGLVVSSGPSRALGL